MSSLNVIDLVLGAIYHTDKSSFIQQKLSTNTALLAASIKADTLMPLFNMVFSKDH